MPRTARLPEDIRSLARSHDKTVIAVLAGIVRQKTAPAAARVAAANVLLDRGHGKPEQVHSGQISGDIQIIIRNLIAEGDSAVVIDQLPEPDDKDK